MADDYRNLIINSTGEIRTEKVTKKFSDLDLDFIPHPVSGDINPLTDAEAIKRSIRNLMFTGTYERLFQPNLGANLRKLLFEPISPMTQLSIQILITDIVRLYEPRITIIDLQVSVDADETGYNVSMSFFIDNTSEAVAVDLFLERLR